VDVLQSEPHGMLGLLFHWISKRFSVVVRAPSVGSKMALMEFFD
jgi:hypothetical protein